MHLDFDGFWKLELEPLDQLNRGRGKEGWSSASLLEINMPDGYLSKFVVKRQKNHTCRTFRHPLRGMPTLEREMTNIMRYKRHGLPSPEPVFYGRKNHYKNIKAVLVTEYLDGYTGLDEMIESWDAQGWPDRQERNLLIQTLASLIRKIHKLQWRHNCLQPKHFLIKKDKGQFQVRFIDLEKNKWWPWGNDRKIKDLESLHRRTPKWPLTDRVRFIREYCDVHKLDKNARQLVRQIAKRHGDKRNR
jgi:hypothetical protein